VTPPEWPAADRAYQHHHAALLGVWACAGRPALGAGCVVVLVGPVGGGPVGWGGHGAQSITHSMKTCAAFALMALP
jgi:hypothetical protein